jgi:hypothetical protein
MKERLLFYGVDVKRTRARVHEGKVPTVAIFSYTASAAFAVGNTTLVGTEFTLYSKFACW